MCSHFKIKFVSGSSRSENIQKSVNLEKQSFWNSTQNGKIMDRECDDYTDHELWDFE